MATPYPQSFVGAPAVTGANLGSTVGRIGPFSAKVGDDLQFRSLVAGAGVALTEGANDITFAATRTNVSLASAGGTQPLVAAGAGPAMQTKGLAAGAGASVTPTGTTVTVANTTEVNTASNLGSGAQLFSAKVGVDFQFRSLVAGAGAAVTQDSPSAGNIQIASTAPGGALNLPWIFSETQASGTLAGYTMATGVPVTRRLNTTDSGSNPSTDVQLAVAPATTYQLRIAAGTYWIRALAGALQVGSHKAFLYDVTGAAIALYGTSEHVQPSGALASCSASRSVVGGFLVVAPPAPRVYELRHVISGAGALTSNPGQPVATGTTSEVYARISLMKIT